jgi:hypothetical protein
MPLKTATFRERDYIPIVERDEENPTTITGTPLSKGEYDSFQDQVMAESVRGGRVRGARKKLLAKLYRNHITRIQNVLVDGEVKPELTNPDEIVAFLTDMEDVETGNEIDNWLLGISVLDEEDEKNSSGRSDSPLSNQKGKGGTAKSAKEEG